MPILHKEYSELRMKKIFIAVAVLCFLCVSAFAQSGLKIFVEESAGSLTIIRSEGKTKQLIIPATINDIPVTAIGDGAFTRKGLTLVTIPDSVTRIGENAFSFNELTTLVIGNNVETIDRGAFSNNKLNDITIGEGVKSIGMGAFMDNELVQVVLPNGLTDIKPYAFFYNRIRNLTIPDSVTAIGEGAFSSNRIYNVVIGNSVSEIGDGAFFNNAITSITVPSGVNTMGERVFESRMTKGGSGPPIDYIDDTGSVIATTSTNFDTYFASSGKRAGKYNYSRAGGWVFEE